MSIIREELSENEPWENCILGSPWRRWGVLVNVAAECFWYWLIHLPHPSLRMLPRKTPESCANNSFKSPKPPIVKKTLSIHEQQHGKAHVLRFHYPQTYSSFGLPTHTGRQKCHPSKTLFLYTSSTRMHKIHKILMLEKVLAGSSWHNSQLVSFLHCRSSLLCFKRKL